MSILNTLGMFSPTSCALLTAVRVCVCRYHKMDKMKSISENLAGKDVVEFPVFHVILSSETSRYLLYSTDTGKAPH